MTASFKIFDLVRGGVRFLYRLFAQNPATRALKKARKFMSQGNDAAALEQYVWFHEHALEHAPGMGGVRRSYALGEWCELADRYPPAMSALERVRQETEIKLRADASNAEWIADIFAIDEQLDRINDSLALYRDLASHNADFAQLAFKHIDHYLLENGELELFRAQVPDLKAYFRQQFQVWRFMHNIAQGATQLMGKRAEREEVREMKSEIIADLRELSERLQAIANSEHDLHTAEELAEMTKRAIAAWQAHPKA